MANFAQATLIGRVGKEPEVRVTRDGKEVASFNMAVDTGWGDNKKTTWWSVICFGKQGEIAAKYLDKGHSVMIVGEPSLEEWSDRDGNKRFTARLVANSITLLEPRKDDSREVGEKPSRAAAKPVNEAAPFDSEIPF